VNNLVVGIGGFWLTTVSLFGFRAVAYRRRMFLREGVPLVGGVGIAFSFTCLAFLGLFFFASIPATAVGIIAASLLMLAFGISDDLFELSVVAKFAVQLIAVTVLIFCGVKTRIIYIGGALNIAVTFLWILGITNAFNLLDILDGLAASVALMISLGFFTIGMLGGDTHTMILSLSLAAAVSSFLVFNLPPAQMYMGNAGSHFLGFLLAAVAVFISYAPQEKPVALFSPLIILGLPIVDTAFLIVIRLLKKSLPFKKSNDHPALKLVASGLSKPRALSLMCLLCLFFVSCGVALVKVPNTLGIAITVLVALASLWFGIAIARIKTV